jgi:hypothetical protein
MGSLKGNVPIGEKMRLAHEGSELTLDDGGRRRLEGDDRRSASTVFHGPQVTSAFQE